MDGALLIFRILVHDHLSISKKKGLHCSPFQYRHGRMLNICIDRFYMDLPLLHRYTELDFQ